MGDVSVLAIADIAASRLAIETRLAIGNRIAVMSKQPIKQEVRSPSVLPSLKISVLT